MGLFKKVFKKTGAESLSLTGGLTSKPAPPPAAPPVPDEEIVLGESAPGAESPAKSAAPASAVAPPVAGKKSAPAAAPPMPMQDERESIRQVWKEIKDLQSQVQQDFERIQDIASSCGEKDRFLFERVRETQEILGGVSDVLAGKSSEKTMAEIDDLLASEIGFGGGAREEGDIQAVLTVLKEKAVSVLNEMKGFLHRTRTALVQATALKQQRAARLAVLENQLNETIQTRDLASDFRKRVISEKKSLESEIDSVNASRQNLETQISLFEEKIQKAMEEKISVEDETRDMDTAREELQGRLESSRREFEETEGILDNLRQTLVGLEEERRAADQNLKSALRDKERIGEDIHVVEKSRQDQGRQITRLEEEIEAVHRQLDNLRQDVLEVQGSVESLAEKRVAHEEATGTEAQRLEELEAALALLLEEKTALEENLEQGKAGLREKQAELQRHTESLVEKNENIQLIQGEIGRMTEELDDLRRQVQELQAAKAGVEKQMETATAAEGPGESIETLEEKLRRLTVERDEFHQTLQKMEQEIRTDEAGVKELLLLKEQEVRNRKDLEDHIRTAEEEVADLRKKLESARKVSSVVKAEGVKARTALDREKQAVEERVETITRLSEDRSALEEEIARADKETEVRVPSAAVSSKDTVYEVVEEGTIGAPPVEAAEELNPSQKKAQRLARVIVSDIILYNKEILKTAANQRNFYEILEQPIKRSDEYYREKVPKDISGDRDYLKEELEKLRLSLKP